MGGAQAVSFEINNLKEKNTLKVHIHLSNENEGLENEIQYSDPHPHHNMNGLIINDK